MTAPAPAFAPVPYETPHLDERLEQLSERPLLLPPSASRRLTPDLQALYDGDLVIPLHDGRPTVLSNFVTTIDGAVALLPGTRSGGRDVSGFSSTDRFVMGLLRAMSDIVLVGTWTVRKSRGSAWTPAGAHPETSEAFADLRDRLGLSRQPTAVVMTERGELDPGSTAFRDADAPVVIAAPGPVAQRLRSAGFPAHVRIEAFRAGLETASDRLLDIATRLGARLVLSEAGPHLTAELFGGGLVDELFVTIAPQLVGREEQAPRLALLEGVALWPSAARWGALASVRRSGDHLFLRYRFTEDRP